MKRICALLLSGLLATQAFADISALVVIEPTSRKDGLMVSREALETHLAKLLGQPVKVTTSEDLTDAMRATRSGGYDVFISPPQVAAMVPVPPHVSFHYVATDGELVTSLTDVRSTQLRVNGGFFAFRQEFFDYLKEGEELVDAPFHRLMDRKQLLAYPHNGFWKAMDTFKDKQELDELVAKGAPPWEVWNLASPALCAR